MAKQKIEKALYGPSWTEVGLGALLGLLAGIAVACVYLTFKPVKTVREPVKDDERVVGVVYYQPGVPNASLGRNWAVQKARFIAGGSVEVSESELNAWAGTDLRGRIPRPAGAPAPAPGDPAAGGFITAEQVNFRIVGDRIQFGFKCHLDYFGVGTDVIVHATGRFESTGDGVAFDADEFYIGSCPLTKLLGVGRPLMSKLMRLHPVSEELTAAWAKVTEARIEGGLLKLTVP